MTSTPESGKKGQPYTPSNHQTTQYSPSATTAAASKPVRSVSAVGASTQPSSLAPTSNTSQGTKQPPLPPPKPVNRSNAAMLGKFYWIIVAHVQVTVSSVHYEHCSGNM